MRISLVRTGLTALIAAGVLTILGAGLASAAPAGPRPTPEAVWSALAHKLGIPVGTLMNDVRAVKLEEFQRFARAHNLPASQVKAGEQAIESGRFAIVLMRPVWARHLLPTVVGAASAALHITPEALQAELQGGRTLTEIAQGHHVPPATVAAAITQALARTIDDAAGRGELSSTRAAELKGRLATMVPRIMAWRMPTSEGDRTAS
jgi:hypothetical protein